MPELVSDLIAGYPYIVMGLLFILGCIVGSFLNVCIVRLPMQKSVLWPGSRCGECLQPVKWHDNLPLISYLRLRGRCRSCGTSFSSRYFWIELFTGLTFAGLFWLEVVQNVHNIGTLPFNRAIQVTGWDLFLVWAYHAVFLSLLIVITFTDIDWKQIPLSINIVGTILGIIGATLVPWPWPVNPQDIDQIVPGWQGGPIGGGGVAAVILLPPGLQWWPVWMPSPSWLPPGSWQMGLVTSLTGAIAGTVMVRLIRLVFGYGLGKEAMGLGDADLMMMIGAFLGWQSLIFTMIFGVFLGLIYAITLVVRSKGSELPFGPFLAGGAVMTLLGSWWLGALFQDKFFDFPLLLALGAVVTGLSFFTSLALRMLRLVGQVA